MAHGYVGSFLCACIGARLSGCVTSALVIIIQDKRVWQHFESVTKHSPFLRRDFRTNFSHEHSYILIQIWLKFVLKCPITSKSALVQLISRHPPHTHGIWRQLFTRTKIWSVNKSDSPWKMAERSPICTFKTVNEYDVTIPITCVCMTSQVNCDVTIKYHLSQSLRRGCSPY